MKLLNKIRAEVDPSAEILVGTTFDENLAGQIKSVYCCNWS